MSKDRVKGVLKTLAALVLLLPVLTGCNSNKLVDQRGKQMDELVESIESGFAEEGWTYTGYEVIDADEEKDTVKVAIAYDVDGDPGELLKAHTSVKPVDDSIYSRAEDINVKVTTELSVYDKENDTIGSSIESTEWFVGDTKADTWIEEQNRN